MNLCVDGLCVISPLPFSFLFFFFLILHLEWFLQVYDMDVAASKFNQILLVLYTQELTGSKVKLGLKLDLV